MFNKTQLTPAQKADRDARKAREKAVRDAEKAELRAAAERAAAARAAAYRERVAAFPEFVVRETREVTVKADNMQDAIALASAAFKEGQDSDYTIKWGKPYDVDGDTIDKIRVTNVKAVELDG